MKVYKCKVCGRHHTTPYCPEEDDPLKLNEEKPVQKKEKGTGNLKVEELLWGGL